MFLAVTRRLRGELGGRTIWCCQLSGFPVLSDFEDLGDLGLFGVLQETEVKAAKAAHSSASTLQVQMYG